MKKNRWGNVSPGAAFVLNVIAILFSALCLLPFLLIISISFTDELTVLREGYQFIPKVFSTEAYRFLFMNADLVGNAYKITILVTLVGTAINVMIIAMYAYPLSRSDFPYKRFFTVFILILMLFNGGFVAQYLINVRVLHLRNNFWALILPSLGGGFYVFVTRTFFQKTIPTEVIESAKIDGAGELRIFRKIVLPLSLPILAVNALMNVFLFWNNWMNSLYYITTPKLYTLQFVMQQALRDMQLMKTMISGGAAEAAQSITNTMPAETARMAMVIVGIGPIIAVYPFFQRYFVKGLTVGAVKG